MTIYHPVNEYPYRDEPWEQATTVAAVDPVGESDHDRSTRGSESSSTRRAPHPQEAETPPWQPIETAPKDGTMILAIEPKNKQRRLVVYHEDWCMWLSVPGRIQVRATHWMPLPAPPVVKTETT